MKKYIPQIFVALIVAYLLFLIRPALLGQLTGTFKPHSIPQEYNKLDEFLNLQKQFSRTFWVPTTQRFGFYSNTHPEISSYDLFHVFSLPSAIDKLRKASTEKILQEAGVKYLIVPYDSLGEIFLKNRKYNNALYLSTIESLTHISYLRKLSGFGKIAVFEIPSPKDHFYLLGHGSVSYAFINPTKYFLTLTNVQKGERLIFSEGYDKYWIAEGTRIDIPSMLYDKLFNSFLLSKSGNYTLTIFYTPQKWVDRGLWISGATLIGVIIALLVIIKIKKKKQI